MKKSNVKRFIIFGQGRSGSNLFVKLLNSHPAIHCDYELMNSKNLPIGVNAIAKTLMPVFPYILIYQRFRKHKNMIYGFKIFNYHLNRIKGIQPKLFDGSWQIFHIQRNDVLSQAISGLVAKQSGKYHRKIDQPIDTRIFQIEPKQVLNSIIYRIKSKEAERKILENIEHYKIIYERDLLCKENWGKSMSKAFEYLGVSPVELTSSIGKTDNRTNNQRIENYSRILEYLRENGFGEIVDKYGQNNT